MIQLFYGNCSIGARWLVPAACARRMPAVETRAWARATGRLGLRFMAERIQAAGGRVRVDSTPGRGTRIVLRLPLAAAW